LCTDGATELNEKDLSRLKENNIQVREEKITELQGKDGILSNILFENGENLARRALFFSTAQYQCSPLAKKLCCTFNEKGTVATGTYETTNIPGLYVAGDASRHVQLVTVAAAEGAEAAFAINTTLLKEDLH